MSEWALEQWDPHCYHNALVCVLSHFLSRFLWHSW